MLVTVPTVPSEPAPPPSAAAKRPPKPPEVPPAPVAPDAAPPNRELAAALPSTLVEPPCCPFCTSTPPMKPQAAKSTSIRTTVNGVRNRARGRGGSSSGSSYQPSPVPGAPGCGGRGGAGGAAGGGGIPCCGCRGGPDAEGGCCDCVGGVSYGVVSLKAQGLDRSKGGGAAGGVGPEEQ